MLASIFYSSQYFFSKIALNENINSLELIISRYIYTGLIMLIFLILFKREKVLKYINKKYIYYSTLIGLCSVLGGYFVYLILTKENFSKIVPLIETITVIISFLIGCFFFKEKISSQLLIGLMFSVIGIYLMKSS